MEKWEYIITNVKVKGWLNKQIDSETEQLLNNLGRDGWELTNTMSIGGGTGGWGAETGGFALIFKRKKQ